MWTAPIKALVAEKFFDLVGLLGAAQIGLATGDASINPDAPVLVCTAEVLANHDVDATVSSACSNRDVGFLPVDVARLPVLMRGLSRAAPRRG